MYYLDIDSGDYLTIERKDKINKKDYQLVKDNIFFKEDKGTTEYTITKNKKYYIFKITSSKENKDSLYKIIKSIK